MAGDWDERTGVDNLTDKLTEPSQKVTYQDLWNAAYRGLVPGGLNANNEPAPALPEGGDGGPEPFDETPQDVVEPYEPPTVDAKPVVIIDDFSRVAGSVESYFNAYQVLVSDVGTTVVCSRDPRRKRVLLRNTGTDIIFIGETESVGPTGYALVPGVPDIAEFPLELATTRQVWATARTAAGETPATATLHVLVEYDKEI